MTQTAAKATIKVGTQAAKEIAATNETKLTSVFSEETTPTATPETTQPTMTVAQEKFQDMMNEIDEAVARLKSDSTIKPKHYAEIAKVIERGERRIAKEYKKRADQIIELQTEMDKLKAFAEKMGYNLEG